MNASGDIPLSAWLIFGLVVVVSLAADLLGHRGGRSYSRRAAIVWSLVWISVALLFGGWVALAIGRDSAEDYLTAWLIEKSLSIDNLFVFLVIFGRLRIAPSDQHRVLFWGIIGALVMRGIFIGAGVGLVSRFHWIFYIFGALLVYSGIRVCIAGHHQIDPATNPLVKTLRRWMHVTPDYQGGKFFVRKENALYVTPLFVVLLVIETTDVLFAVDSIPAILGITLNAFIVYTSNVLAILGLRSMYFAVARLLKVFRFLHYGLAVVLILVGLKMLIADYIRIDIGDTLSIVAEVLFISIVASVLYPGGKKKIDD
jgi:tellurite resistance protein TerC